MATVTAPSQTERTRPSGEQHRHKKQRVAGSVRSREAARFPPWLTVLGGSALAIYGLSRRSLGGLGLATLGAGLASRSLARQPEMLASLGAGITGGVRVEETMAVLATPDVLYRFWRDFENMPRFMKYIQSVSHRGENRYRWVARGPLGVPAQWDAEIIQDHPDESIAWRSLPSSFVRTEGAVHFSAAPGDRGSIVRVVMRYHPPAGKLGDALAKLFGRSAQQEIREDLRRFKRLVETGEIPTTRGQSSGRGREAWEQTAGMIVQSRMAKGLAWFGIGLGLAELLAPRALGKVIGVHDSHLLLRAMGAREIATGIGALRQPRQPAWLWGRVLGDALDLSLLGLALSSPCTGKVRASAATLSVLGVTALDVAASLHGSCGGSTLRSMAGHQS